MRILDCYVFVEDRAHLVFHRRSMTRRSNRRERGEKQESLYHSLLQDCLRILSGPAWIRTRDQRIMSLLLLPAELQARRSTSPSCAIFILISPSVQRLTATAATRAAIAAPAASATSMVVQDTPQALR